MRASKSNLLIHPRRSWFGTPVEYGARLKMVVSTRTFNHIGEYEEQVAYDEVAARLRGFLHEWYQHQVVKITKFDPARVGWGLAQNSKIRKHAVALSILVPLLLDKHCGKCKDEFVSSFCTMAAAKRPPAA